MFVQSYEVKPLEIMEGEKRLNISQYTDILFARIREKEQDKKRIAMTAHVILLTAHGKTGRQLEDIMAELHGENGQLFASKEKDLILKKYQEDVEIIEAINMRKVIDLHNEGVGPGAALGKISGQGLLKFLQIFHEKIKTI